MKCLKENFRKLRKNLQGLFRFKIAIYIFFIFEKINVFQWVFYIFMFTNYIHILPKIFIVKPISIFFMKLI